MPTSKTRNLLVDVARQLFARDGVENTTMNDIAVASKKGRRTVYTYFKSKEELYMAVVESELEMLAVAMRKVASKNLSPDEKIMEIIYTRLDSIKEVVTRNGSLKADFFRDVLRVEKVRRNFDITEVKLYRGVLQEGVDKGVFDIDSVYLTADLLHYCLKGIEVPYIRGKIAPSLTGEIRTEYVTKLVLGAFHRKK